MIHRLPLCLLCFSLLLAGCASSHSAAPNIAGIYNVKDFAATGDGTRLDTSAVNNAIDAVNRAGGGTLRFPPGTYLCHSIHLKSNVTIYLEQGATIMAAPPAAEGSSDVTYDAPEPNPFDPFEDFGHSHWHNSLIWGENLENIAILGPGRIDGSKGLVRRVGPVGDGVGPQSPNPPPPERWWQDSAGHEPIAPNTDPGFEPSYPNPRDTVRSGLANKAIALKLCHNVILRDFSIFAGGHFAILATGVDNFTLDNLKIDTNRDGMDIDCCRNVRVSNCTVNSPFDDAICLKSCYALGMMRATENVTVTNCQVSGYVCGSLLDGTCIPFNGYLRDFAGPTGRIKLGTESSGGFKNITISNCTCDYSRGLAVETVDGGPLEDVIISNITMRHCSNSPIFIRLGSRLRSPNDTPVSTCQRININNIIVYDAGPRYCSIISGIPGYNIKDVVLSHIQVFAAGGGTKKWAATQTAEKEKKYPEPNRFGETGAYGFFIRHVDGIKLDDIKLTLASEDARAPFILNDVSNVQFTDINAQHNSDVPFMVLKKVKDLTTHQFRGLADTQIPWVEDQQLSSDSH